MQTKVLCQAPDKWYKNKCFMTNTTNQKHKHKVIRAFSRSTVQTHSNEKELRAESGAWPFVVFFGLIAAERSQVCQWPHQSEAALKWGGAEGSRRKAEPQKTQTKTTERREGVNSLPFYENMLPYKLQ